MASVYREREPGGSTRFLVLDSRIIETVENAVLVTGTVRKAKENPLFGEDRPWEPRADNVYANVIYDRQETCYKCWYSPFLIDERTTSTPPENRNARAADYRSVTPNRREMGVCYAISEDGIHWQKPALGLVEFEGSTENNILMRATQSASQGAEGPHGAGVFEDMSEPDPTRRYKMFLKTDDMAVSFSPDGLHWIEPIPCPEICGAGDTHNDVLWAPDVGEYVGFTRVWSAGPPPRRRFVARTESKDFVHWSRSEVVLEPLEPHLHPHDMIVFAHAGVYLGLVGILDEETGRQHVELAWSPDTIAWHRIAPGAPLIPNGAAPGDPDWGCIFASKPVFLTDEIRLYYGAGNGRFYDWRNGFLCMVRLRPDSFAGYAPVEEESSACVTTAPLVCNPKSLRVCADIKADGWLKVRVLGTGDGVQAESYAFHETATDEPVVWPENVSFEGDGKHPVRFSFEFHQAIVYSFSCTGES